jgi:hypothetical protein
MAVLMVLRGSRVFPVRYDWPRLGALCALAAALFALGEVEFPARGTGGVAGRLVISVLFIPLALIANRAVRASARRW